MRQNIINILIIEDEAFDVERIRNTLRPFEDRIKVRDVVSNGKMALELIQKNTDQYDVVIMDFQIAGGLRGETLIRRMKEIDNHLQVVVVTKMTVNITDFDFAQRLLDAGALWYCTKYPGDIEEFIYQPTDFILNIFNAAEKKKLEKGKRCSDQRLEKRVREYLQTQTIIGESETTRHLKKLIEQCAALETHVLLQGESGTGKELVASHIHHQGARRIENFVPVNCGSLPDHLIESELFGFEKGAFTGATDKKKGLFELANNGTIFLDEIAELPMATQSVLLRVLQEGEIDKIGRTGKTKVNVRVIAATNKNLREEVKAKRFREDLFYRLNVVSLVVPPLRERRRDIPILIQYFTEIFRQKMKAAAPDIQPDAMMMLCGYDWPGNVRELQNVVQRLLFANVPVIEPDHVRQALGHLPVLEESDKGGLFHWDPLHILSWREMERQIKKAYFRFVRENTGTDAAAARALGLAPSNYHRMSKEMGLKS